MTRRDLKARCDLAALGTEIQIRCRVEGADPEAIRQWALERLDAIREELHRSKADPRLLETV